MPVIFQKRIYRDDLIANRDILYVFGDNVKRVGLGGQAAEMRGEPNAVGVATKWNPSTSPQAYFYNDNYDEAIRIIDKDLLPVISALQHGATVVIPLDGLGTGLSELPTRAPRINSYLQGRIQQLTKLTSL